MNNQSLLIYIVINHMKEINRFSLFTAYHSFEWHLVKFQT
jgi:hypothetical protein